MKTKSSSKWGSSLIYDVPAFSSVTINVDLKWEETGMQELTFFPLEKTSDVYRYNGNVASYRFFVQSKDIKISKEMLEEQSFTLNSNEMTSEQKYLPEPSWTGVNNSDLEYLINDGVALTNKAIDGVKFEAVPYDTKLDILLVDEFGNSTLIEENVIIKKNQVTYIKLKKDHLENMNKKSVRQFLLFVNNREERLMADIKTVELNKKPFPTSHQSILEFYKSDIKY